MQKKATRTTGGHNNGNNSDGSSDTKCCDGIVLMHLEQQQWHNQRRHKNSITCSLEMRALDASTMADGLYAPCATLRIRIRVCSTSPVGTTCRSLNCRTAADAAAAGTPMAPRSPSLWTWRNIVCCCPAFPRAVKLAVCSCRATIPEPPCGYSGYRWHFQCRPPCRWRRGRWSGSWAEKSCSRCRSSCTVQSRTLASCGDSSWELQCKETLAHIRLMIRVDDRSELQWTTIARQVSCRCNTQLNCMCKKQTSCKK